MGNTVPRLGRKIALSAVVMILIGALGVFYQYYYLEERGEFERSIRRSYIKLHGTDPDPQLLRHLAVLALDRYGPTEFHRTEDDYKQLLAEERE